MKRLVFAGAALALICTASTPAHSAYRSRTSAAMGFVTRLLAAHNLERARMGVGPLRWDPRLAAAAASYGPMLARMGRLQHSPKSTRPGQRENLWMGTRGSFSPEQMVGYWTREKAFFRRGTFPYVSRTGNWADVSHYTQMIWKGTTHVGCAVYRAARFDYLICRYSPPGNVDGHRV